MRVLVVSTNSDNAGAPKHVEDIVLGLRPNCEFLVLFGSPGPVSSRLEASGVSVKYLSGLQSSISPIDDLRVLLRLVSYIKEFNPDLIHLHSSKAGLIGRIAGFITKKRVLFTVHGWSWNSVSGLKRSLFMFLEKLLINLLQSDFIVVSNSTFKEGVTVLGDKFSPAIVVYNGVDDFGFRLRSRGDKLKIVMPARVSYPKDHFTLVRALTFVDFDFEVVFCGGGTSDVSFVNEVQKLDPFNFEKYRFLGDVENLASLYSEANMLVLSSYSEALPLSILEGMSAGLVIVASDVGGIPEAVFPDLNGKLFLAGSPEALSEAISTIYFADLFQIYSAESRKLYEEKFSKTKMLRETLSVYHLDREC